MSTEGFWPKEWLFVSNNLPTGTADPLPCWRPRKQWQEPAMTGSVTSSPPGSSPVFFFLWCRPGEALGVDIRQDIIRTCRQKLNVWSQRLTLPTAQVLALICLACEKSFVRLVGNVFARSLTPSDFWNTVSHDTALLPKFFLILLSQF